MERSVTRVLKALDIIDDGDMRLLRALPLEQQTAVGPNPVKTSVTDFVNRV